MAKAALRTLLRSQRRKRKGTNGSSSSNSGVGDGDKAKINISTDMTANKAGELWNKLNAGQHTGSLGPSARQAANCEANGGAATVGEDDSGKGATGDSVGEGIGGERGSGDVAPPPPPEESPAPPPPAVDETPPPTASERHP